MKLVRYGDLGHEQPGLIDQEGRLRALGDVITDIDCAAITAEGLANLRSIPPSTLPLVQGTPRFGAPIANPRQFIAVGRNYAAHVQEAKFELPTQPMVFSKAITSIAGSGDDIPLYRGSVRLDYEVELAIVISKPAYRVEERQALEYVAGYCICNDVSEREWQYDRGGVLSKGKSAPGYGPLGPWLVTADEVGDPQNLRLRTKVNGTIRQDGETAHMIFSVANLIAHVTEFMALLPGDILTTGTPDGVALGMKPPQWLREDDIVEMDITGLGTMRQRVVARD